MIQINKALVEIAMERELAEFKESLKTKTPDEIMKMHKERVYKAAYFQRASFDTVAVLENTVKTLQSWVK